MSTLTSDEAIELLRTKPSQYLTADSLRQLVARVDANSYGDITVTYSGKVTGDLSAERIALSMNRTMEGVRIINNSQAAELLQSREFLNATAQAFGLGDFRTLNDPSNRKHPANDWLYHSKEGPWADVFNHKDSDGVKWKYNGSYWERPAQFESADSLVKKGVAASYEKQLELNARANAVAADLALAKPAKLLEPFDIPAKPEEQKGLGNGNWKRDPESGDWHRQIRQMSLHSERSIYTTEVASPERASELDAEAVQRVLYNIANGPEAIAMAYMESHTKQRSGEFAPIPDSVRRALPEADTVTASNGQTYRLDSNRTWSDGQNQASGNLALELELTRQARQPYLEQFDRQITDLQSIPAPSLKEIESNDLIYRYRIVGTELKPDWQQAIQLATEQTRISSSIEGFTTQQLLPNKINAIAADSPIAHFQQGPDGINRQVALTTTEDIERALVQVRQAATQTLAEVKVSAQMDATTGQSPSPTEKPIGPDNDAHPDYALLQQIRGGVRQEDEKVGRSYDDSSERLSRSLLAACKDNRDAYPQCASYSLAANAITRADHVLLGKDNMFVVQGGPGDPASLRAHVNISIAMSTPLEASDRKLEAANLLIGQERERALLQEAERTRGQEAMTRGF